MFEIKNDPKKKKMEKIQPSENFHHHQQIIKMEKKFAKKMTKCMDLKKIYFLKKMNDPSRKRFNYLSFYQQQQQQKRKTFILSI